MVLVLKPVSSSPSKVTLSSPLNSLPTADTPPLSSRPSSPPLIKSPPFSRRLGRWRSSSPPFYAAHLFDTDFPTIQASHTFASKFRRPTAVVAPPARGLGALPPSPSPPTFQSSYTTSQFCYEIPDSYFEVGGAPGRQDSPSTQTVNPVCVDSELGPLGPVPSAADSLPGVPGSPGSCDGEVVALPLPGLRSPCQAPEFLSVGLPGVIINPASSAAPSLGELGLSSVPTP